MGVTSFRYGGGGASRGERCGVGGAPARALMSVSAYVNVNVNVNNLRMTG